MDETACISVYTIIGECIIGMQKEIVTLFVDKVKTIAPMDLQIRDVELLHTIGKQCQHRAQSKHVCDALWDLVV